MVSYWAERADLVASTVSTQATKAAKLLAAPRTGSYQLPGGLEACQPTVEGVPGQTFAQATYSVGEALLAEALPEEALSELEASPEEALLGVDA